MKNCLFSFVLCGNSNISVAGLTELHRIGNYNFLCDINTPFCAHYEGQYECALFGFATNVLTGDHEDLPKKILQNCRSIEEVIEYEKYLGGKYIILYFSPKGCYILCDATSSIPVYYDTEGDLICSSNPQYILNEKKYNVDPEFSHIRNSSDISQAMPFDITQFREIKQLLPNHCLNVGKKKAFRFVNSLFPQEEVSVERATELVSPMINNLLSYYLSQYEIYCPITSGRDSRVVLAFLMKAGAGKQCYTMKHPYHTDLSQDIAVPKAICGANGLHHEVVEDVDVPNEVKSVVDTLLGKGRYSDRTLQIALTVKEYCKGAAIINGDIIGQVGKCSLHRDIPAIFATPSYFRCKLHNYSRGAKKQLRLWLKEISDSGEMVNTFDLFSIENRMGRWAVQSGMVYSTIGQVQLNIFNSRTIIYTWTAVDRKKRKNSILHIDLIKDAYAGLLDIPFEKEESLAIKLSKANWLTFWVSSYLKYYIEKSSYKYGFHLFLH